MCNVSSPRRKLLVCGVNMYTLGRLYNSAVINMRVFAWNELLPSFVQICHEKQLYYVYSECKVRSIEVEPSGSRIYHPASPHRVPEVFFFHYPLKSCPLTPLLAKS